METCAQWINNDSVITIKSSEYNSCDSRNTTGGEELNRVAEAEQGERQREKQQHLTLFVYVSFAYYAAITD